MKIEVLYFNGCPNYLPAVNRLRAVLKREGVSAEVSEVEVKDEPAAQALEFPGSPTIRINGLDIEPISRTTAQTGMACRRYPGGLPSEEMMLAAVRAARAGRSNASRVTLASIAAIGSVIAASSCCLPILPFFFAAGFAGASAVLSAARPFLLGASILFIAYGFVQAWRTKQCHRRPGLVQSLLLWTSTLFVVVSIFFPQVLANAAATLLAH